MSRAAVVDVCLDDDFNIFALGSLAGRPHVMSCSLFGQGKRRWMHRFMEHFEPASLTCISAGQSLVALGSKVSWYQSVVLVILQVILALLGLFVSIVQSAITRSR